MQVDISGLPKGAVLAALYNASNAQGLGVLEATPYDISPEVAEEIFRQSGPRFDYLNGRVLKVNLSGDEFDASLYDRDNGEEAAKTAIADLREREGGRG